MKTEIQIETSIENIKKANDLGLNKHFGVNNFKWNGGNRTKGINPCPSCGKRLFREKRYLKLLCRECSNKNRKIREFKPDNVSRAAYYWRARKIIERIGIKLGINDHVHHKNGNWKDNNIENLEVIDKYEHRKKYHNKKSEFFIL